MFNGFCPACASQVPTNRILGGTAVCRCGWTSNESQTKKDLQLQKKTIIVYMVFATVVLLGYAHLLNWGAYAFGIPFLKAAQAVDVVSASGLETIIEACYANAKWSCVDQAHLDLFRKTGNPETLARLARFQIRTNRLPQAAATFEDYARAGGQDANASFDYAQLLEKSGQSAQALEWYGKAVDNSQERLPVRAMTGLLRLLKSDGRYQEAYDRLVAFQKSSGNGTEFFGGELKELETLIKPTKSKRMASR